MSLRPRKSLPLWLHCIVEGIFQGLTRGLRHKFLPHQFQFVQDAATMEPMAVSTGKRLCQHWDGRTQVSAASEEKAWREYFIIFYTNKPRQDPCTMWLWSVVQIVFEIQGCGNIVLVKYQLMAYESASLFMLMISFFLLQVLEKQCCSVRFHFLRSLEHCLCFSLLTVTHAALFLLTCHMNPLTLKACSVIAKYNVKFLQIVLKWFVAPLNSENRTQTLLFSYSFYASMTNFEPVRKSQEAQRTGSTCGGSQHVRHQNSPHMCLDPTNRCSQTRTS